MTIYDWLVLAICGGAVLSLALASAYFSWRQSRTDAELRDEYEVREKGRLDEHEKREFDRQDTMHAAHMEWLTSHEKKAVERETRAIERHETEMKALQQNRALTLAAIDHRDRLADRVKWLELVSDNHASHLQALGRTGVQEIPRKEGE